MIDLHSHILPGVDDGARNIDETMKLLREAQDVGFESIISTSHYMEGYYETAIQERKMLIEAINQKFSQYNINIEIYLGNEVYLSENMIQLLEERKASTINNTSYILFEMPLNIEPMNLYDIVYELIQCKLVPILAHPERYSFVQQDPELIYDLIDLGVLMQANYASIIRILWRKSTDYSKKIIREQYDTFFRK